MASPVRIKNEKGVISDTNPLPTSSQDSFYLRIAMDDVAGYSIVNKFGQNSDIGTGAYEDVWDGGATYSYPADGTATIANIRSTDAADTMDIEVQGLDINGDLVVQTETLTGTTPVNLSTPLWRIFRMKNISSVDNVGDISAQNSTASIIYAIIQIGNNQTLMALYTIPAGKSGYLLSSSVSMAGLTRAYSIAVKFTARPFGGVHQLKATNGLSSDGSSFTNIENLLPSKIGEKTDLKFSAISTTNGGVMNARFAILLVDN